MRSHLFHGFAKIIETVIINPDLGCEVIPFHHCRLVTRKRTAGVCDGITFRVCPESC